MSEEKKSVFISYARQDHEAALRIYNDLKKSGLEPWLDTKSILPGERWKVSIAAAIPNCDYFLALLSSNSVSKKGYVQKELKYALDVFDEIPEHEVFIIPARLDDCSPSHAKLSDIQWADLFPSWEKGLSKILLAMKVKLADRVYNIVPDELETYVLNHIDISNLQKRSSWYPNYSAIVEEFEGDETLFIFWDEIRERLVKYYLSYDGVRWFGPHNLTLEDKRKVMTALSSLPSKG